MTRVVKIGGSLLSQPDFSHRVNAWLANELPHRTAFIVGGGGVIEAMRDADSRFSLDQAQMHWRCVRLLRSTFEIVAELLPNLKRIENASDLKAWRQESPKPSAALIAVDCFYHPNSTPQIDLPCDWRTTTDSIAAELAVHLGAQEVILLKSTALPEGLHWEDAAKSGLVDEAFPNAAKHLHSAKIINLAT